MDFKELYIAEVERISAELEDRGIDPDRAYDMASNAAFDSARDRLADMADMADTLRQRAKDGE